jgi:hypothetical protein
MPFRKSPQLTLALLAANRLNAQKSTGPRTAEGKARVALNALKHGHRATHFRTRLAKAREDVELYDWILDRVCSAFLPINAQDQRCADRLAREVWCDARRVLGVRTKPESPLESTLRRFRVPLRIRITDSRNDNRLTFYIKRKRGTVPPRVPVAMLPAIRALR